MQVVIEIYDELYDIIKREKHEGKHLNVYERAIMDGTVLPTHGRLIDANKTISEICGSSCGCHLEECGHDEPCFSVTRIKSAFTVLEASNE